jgi:hypothetical protein
MRFLLTHQLHILSKLFQQIAFNAFVQPGWGKPSEEAEGEFWWMVFHTTQ